MNERKLDVYLGERLVGTLAETADHRVAFAYQRALCGCLAGGRFCHQSLFPACGAKGICAGLTGLSGAVGRIRGQLA